MTMWLAQQVGYGSEDTEPKIRRWARSLDPKHTVQETPCEYVIDFTDGSRLIATKGRSEFGHTRKVMTPEEVTAAERAWANRADKRIEVWPLLEARRFGRH